MENIKISIVVPVYNAEKYLSKCLDSLINQTLKEIEIICINDGSKDNSETILRAYQQKDSRIQVISQENKGLSITRNIGIAAAKGEYIGLVDSDDWLDLDFYEKLYNAAKKYNSDIAAGDFYRRGKILKTQKLKYKKEEFFKDNAEKVKQAGIPKYNYVWNKIYKRESLEKINCPFPVGRYYEDICWLVKVVYYLDGFVTVPNTFYHYRRSEGSIITQKTAKHKADCRSAEIEMLNFMQSKNIPIQNPCKMYKRATVRFLGIKILKIEHYYPDSTVYKLFGFINILRIDRQS